MKAWVESVVELCANKGPQSAPQLAEFLAAQHGIDNTPSSVIYRLRACTGVTVERTGNASHYLYLVTRKAAAVAGAAS
jgi:hypothetical protein